MYNFEEAFINACNGMLGRDLHEHLPTLANLAKDCKHVTEMGVWHGTSSHAWLINDVELVSYDIAHSQIAAHLFSNAMISNKKAQYIVQNVLELETIVETDLLFIDTLHNYEQCSAELNKFADKVRKYIVFHDTVTFGKIGETTPNGLLLAIGEFLVNNLEWSVKVHYTNNNGLTVLERNVHLDSSSI
jgi:hypothetical protein